MNSVYLEHINEWFDPYDLFSGTGRKKIRTAIKDRFPSISAEEQKEFEDYLEQFEAYCINYAQILADKYKTPFLPSDEDSRMEIDKYVAECQKIYPEFNRKVIRGLFSTVCWLSNR